MLKVISVDECINLFGNIRIVEDEEVDIDDALNRVLSTDIVSKQNLPGFNRSSVDGYALKAKDTYLCSESMPAVLCYKGEIKIGIKPEIDIEDGECVYIPTGGMMPKGADGVAMIEDCEGLKGDIVVNKSLARWENVVFEDDDVACGNLVIGSGTTINSNHAAVLSGLGKTRVRVKRRIRVGIISTGDELISPYDEQEVPKVRDINGFYLKQVLKEDGCLPNYYGIVGDDEEDLYNSVKMALDENDMVFLSGGSSAGNRDFTINIMERLGRVLFHGIAVKPGKPTLMADCHGKYIIGLPGHPLSCAVVYRFIIKKLIDSMYCRKRDELYIEGAMAQNYHKAKGREEYLPVTIKDGIVNPIYVKSSAISVIARCRGFVRIERDAEGILEGQRVEVLL